jgi:hypothetical protein
MPNPDNPPRLNEKQRREIKQVGEAYQLNLAPPPTSWNEITSRPQFVSLETFIEQFNWTYSDLDIIDRREIKHLSTEDLCYYIFSSGIPVNEPAYLSPTTVAKAIAHGVNLLGSFIESYLGRNECFVRDTEPQFSKLARASLELACRRFASTDREHNWYAHFQLLMQHPVIDTGVQIASWHQYRLPDTLLGDNPL